jgi:predicted metal-dependent peptidase
MNNEPKQEASDELKKLARTKITDALCYLLGGNRFYYYILSNIQIKSSKDVQNIEVGFADKNSKKICIRYNPEFIANFHYEHPKTGQPIKFEFTEQEMADIFIHELLHICLRHLFDVGQYPDKDILNYAQDVVVNDMIFRNRYEYTRPPTEDPLASEKRPSLVNFLVTKHLFDSTKNLNIQEHTFGDIYGLLEKEIEKKPQMKQQLGQKGEKGQLIKDGHAEFQPGDGESQDEAEQGAKAGEIEAMVKNLLNKAMKEDFDRGRLPAELLKELNALEPKKDYRDTLNHFVKNCKVEVLQNTWRKPSKRYGFIARGKTADFKPKILLGVDSSGSVFCHPKALEKIGEYFNFAVNYCEKIRLIYCDTTVRLDKDFVQGDAIPPIDGGGGTVMQPIFDKGLEDEYDAVILITDGYTDNINTHGLPHLALIVPGGVVPPGIDKNNTVFFNDSDA